MSHDASVQEPPQRIRRILVATDFSAAARMAVWRAGQLAQQNEARLHIVHAQPDWNLFAHSGTGTAEHFRVLQEHTGKALTEELQYVEKTFGIAVTGESRIGRASAVLRSATAEFSPHLIVVGARGEHEPTDGAPLLGGTALKLIAFASCPVLLVRRPGTAPYEVSLVAIESPSNTALTLIAWARALAFEGKCHVVHAFDAPYIARLRARGVAADAISAITDHARAAAGVFVDDIMRSCHGSLESLSTHLVCGEPVSAVLAELDRTKPDVAVVGKHGHPPRDMLSPSIGSVALRIAYHAACDVLVVPN